MSGIWLNDWHEFNLKKLEDVFRLHRGALDDIELLLASYTETDDSGYAFVLYKFASKLYEVNASHDSALDFSGQWQPEETTIEALVYRVQKGNLGSASASENIFADELMALLHSHMQ